MRSGRLRAKVSGVLGCFLLLACLPPAHAQTEGDVAWLPTLPLRQQGRTHLSLFGGGEGYAFHSNGGDNGFLYATTDFGLTWEPRLAPPLSSTGMMEFGNATKGYALGFGGGEIFQTDDGARTWQKGTSLPVGQLGTVDAVDAQGELVVAAGNTEDDIDDFCAPPADDPVEMFVSRTGGDSWRKHELPWGHLAFDVEVWGDRYILVLVNEMNYERTGQCGWSGSGTIGERVYFSTDQGRTFKKVLECVPNSCLALGMASPRHFAVGRIEGDVSVTFDGGQNFKEFRLGAFVEPPQSYLYWVSGVQFADDRVVYASTNGRGVWRSEDGGRTWAREMSTQEIYGIGIGDLAVGSLTHAIAGGPNFVVTRVPRGN